MLLILRVALIFSCFGLLAACGESGLAPAAAMPPTTTTLPPPADAALPTPFRVGAAKAKLALPEGGICTGGYGIFCVRKPTAARVNSRGVTDDLHTRAIALRDAEGETLVVITTSVIGLFSAYKPALGAADDSTRPGLYQIRGAIADAADIPIENVLIQSDHSHFSPDTVGIWGGSSEGEPFEALLKAYADSMQQTAAEAIANLEPAALMVGAVDGAAVACPTPIPFCVVNSLYSSAPNLFTDEVFRLIEARRADGSAIARWVNYSPHATVLDDYGDDVALSGDWAGWMAGDLDQSGDCGARRCTVGLATLATLGRTDFNNSREGTADDASGPEKNLQRERLARARLDYFMSLLKSGAPQTGVMPFTTVTGDNRIAVRERLIRESVTQGIFYANHAPFVGLPDALSSQIPFAEDATGGSTASIDRANTPPWLTGNVIAAPVSAFRVGDLFFGTAPGEEFPNAMQRMREEGGVAGPQMHFFLGTTNDFIGYMGPANGYAQIAAQGTFYLAGCPEDQGSDPFRDFLAGLERLGYDPERVFDSGSCPDHFILMTSPTIGDHVTCSIQAMAGELGFVVGTEDQNCPVYTATDRPGGRVADAPL